MAQRLIFKHTGSSYALYLDDGIGQVLSIAENVPFQDPLGEGDVEGLRWYIEDYIEAPFGAYRERTKRVIKSLETLSASITKLILFNDAAATKLQNVLEERDLQIWIQSNSPEVLSVPWELLALRRGDGQTKLANVVRSCLPATAINDVDLSTSPAPAPDAATRVLFIISRPLGGRDVGFGIVCRPILQAFEAFNDSIDVHVLRPPTFDSLKTCLADASRSGRPFTVIHFDGHGSLRMTGDAGSSTSAAAGVVYFEKDDRYGGFKPVSAEQLAAVLRNAGTKFVIFNACESAGFATHVPPEAVVATRLLQEGISAVVGMAYSVRVETAAAFMQTLYATLLNGVGIIAAVHAARIKLAERVAISSNSSEMDHDWFVPVLYAARDDSLASPAGTEPVAAPPPAHQTILGRDAEFYELERQFRTNPALLLYGPIGSGKTTHLDDFLVWLRSSRGTVTNTRLVRHDLKIESPQAVLADLRRCRQTIGDHFVIALDNIDQLRNLDAARELVAELRSLLKFSGLKTIITSRGPELWLGDIPRVRLPSLPERLAAQLVSRSTDRTPSQANLKGLVEASLGNPGYLVRALPVVENPNDLVVSLWQAGLTNAAHSQSLLRLFPEVEEAAGKLPPHLKSIACLLSLFSRFVDPMILTFASLGSELPSETEIFRLPPLPPRFRGTNPELWEQLLLEIEALGLASEVGEGHYELHPVTPVALNCLWRREAGETFSQELIDSKRCLVAILSTFCGSSQMSATTGLGPLAGAASDLSLLEKALGCAIHESMFTDAFIIFRTLANLRSARGGGEEQNKLSETTREIILKCRGQRPLPADPARELWLLTFGNQNLYPTKESSDALTREAELILREVDEGYPVENTEQAFAYHALGAAAGNEGRNKDSEDWYRKALELAENDESGFMTYRNLAILAAQREDFDEFDALVSRARTIAAKSDFTLPTNDLLSLEGIVALKRGQTDKAVDLQDQFLTEMDNQTSLSQLAGGMHEMGIAQVREGNLREAETFFKKAIRYKMLLQNKDALVSTYTSLGSLKMQLGETEEAENWFREAQAILDETQSQARPGLPERMLITRAELLQHQHKYDEICQLLEPMIQGPEIVGDRQHELFLNQARVLLALSYLTTGRRADVRVLLNAAVRELERFSRESATGEVLRYLGMALSIRAGTHANEEAALLVDDALSGCEQLLASLKLDKDVRGSLDYYVGLSLMFALSRIRVNEDAAAARTVSVLDSWLRHLRDSDGGAQGKDDFFPTCIARIAQLLVSRQDYATLAAILNQALDVIFRHDSQRWPDRSRALAESVYYISNEVTAPGSSFIISLNLIRFSILVDFFPGQTDIAAMVFESYTWAASHLCGEGHLSIIEELTDDLKKHSENTGDQVANAALSKIYVYLIAAYCGAGKPDESMARLAELHDRIDSSEVPGVDLVAYSFSVRNVVVILVSHDRLEAASKITSQCVKLAGRFAESAEITNSLLECAVSMVDMFATREMFTDADVVVSQLEALRGPDKKVHDLEFRIANAFLVLFQSSLEIGRLPLALAYRQRLWDLQALAPADHRIAGVNVLTSGQLMMTLAATDHLDEALLILPEMFAACFGKSFGGEPEAAQVVLEILTKTVAELKNQLERAGDLSGGDRTVKLIQELSAKHHCDIL